jgi:hypothetical protein
MGGPVWMTRPYCEGIRETGFARANVGETVDYCRSEVKEFEENAESL